MLETIVGFVTAAVVGLFLLSIAIDEFGRGRAERTVYANRLRNDPEYTLREKIWSLQFMLGLAVAIIVLLVIVLIA